MSKIKIKTPGKINCITDFWWSVLFCAVHMLFYTLFQLIEVLLHQKACSQPMKVGNPFPYPKQHDGLSAPYRISQMFWYNNEEKKARRLGPKFVFFNQKQVIFFQILSRLSCTLCSMYLHPNSIPVHATLFTLIYML